MGRLEWPPQELPGSGTGGPFPGTFRGAGPGQHPGLNLQPPVWGDSVCGGTWFQQSQMSHISQDQMLGNKCLDKRSSTGDHLGTETPLLTHLFQTATLRWQGLALGTQPGASLGGICHRVWDAEVTGGPRGPRLKVFHSPSVSSDHSQQLSLKQGARLPRAGGPLGGIWGFVTGARGDRHTVLQPRRLRVPGEHTVTRPNPTRGSSGQEREIHPTLFQNTVTAALPSLRLAAGGSRCFLQGDVSTGSGPP